MYYEYEVSYIGMEGFSLSDIKDKLISSLKKLINFLQRKLIDFMRSLTLTDRILVTNIQKKAFLDLVYRLNVIRKISAEIIHSIKNKNEISSTTKEELENINNILDQYIKEIRESKDTNRTCSIDYRDIKKSTQDIDIAKVVIEKLTRILDPNSDETTKRRAFISEFISVVSKWSQLFASILYSGKGKTIFSTGNESFITYFDEDWIAEEGYMDIFSKSKDFIQIMRERKKKITQLKKDKTKDNKDKIISIYSENIETLQQLRIEVQRIQENAITIMMVDGIGNALSSIVNASTISNLLLMWGGVGTSHIPKAVVIAAGALVGVGTATVNIASQSMRKVQTGKNIKDIQSNTKSRLLKKIDNAIVVEKYWLELEKEGMGIR